MAERLATKIHDVEDQSVFLCSMLTDIVNEHMPRKNIRVRDRDVPYMNVEWKEAIRTRKKAVSRL